MARMSERPKNLRPREKLQKRGVNSLSDYELIMAIIGSGNAVADVTQIAREVLKVIKQRGVDLRYEDLTSIKALGPAKAAQFMAGYELWRRRLQAIEQPTIDNISDAVAQLSDIRNKKQEYFVCLSLDNHPSGTIEPSPEDIQTTKRLKQAAELLGIGFYDHLIVTADDYRSILSTAEWHLANNA